MESEQGRGRKSDWESSPIGGGRGRGDNAGDNDDNDGDDGDSLSARSVLCPLVPQLIQSSQAVRHREGK